MTIQAHFTADHRQVEIKYKEQRIAVFDVDQRVGEVANQVFVSIDDEDVPLDVTRFALLSEGVHDLKELLPFIAMQAKENHDPTLDIYRSEVVEEAARGDHLEIVNALLAGIEGADLEVLRSKAVLGAVRGGHLEVVRELLSDGAVISEGVRAWAVIGAVSEGHLEIVRALLAGGSAISESKREWAVLGAVRGGYLEIVRELLANGQISIYRRSSSVLAASSNGQFEIVEALLQSGPITRSAQQSAITQASGARRGEILDILSYAQIVDQRGQVISNPDALELTFDGVKENPRHFLAEVATKGFPSSIFQLDAPETIDLGGVTKQFITVLVESLRLRTILDVSERGLPTIDTNLELDPEKVSTLKDFGTFYSHIDKRNNDRTDKFLTGAVFHSEFFALLRVVQDKEIDDAVWRESAPLLKEVDPTLEMPANMLLNPSDEAKEAYAEIMGVEKEEVVETAKETLLPYLEAAKAFYLGTTSAFKDKIQRMEPAALCTSVQGEAITNEGVLRVIHFEGDLGEQEQWLREKIQTADGAWLKQFVRVITGREAIAPGMSIKIKRCWREVFEVHTCFNSLDLPPGDMSKEDFLEGLDAAIADEKYNIG
jgi:hypothetical protein